MALNKKEKDELRKKYKLREYAEQEKETSFLKELGIGIAKPFVKFGSSVSSLLQGAGLATGAAIQDAVGNKEKSNELLQKADNSLSTKNFDIFGNIKPIGSQNSFSGGVKDILSTGTEIGSYFTGGGAAKNIATQTGRQLFKGGVSGGIKEVAKRGAIEGGLSGLLGGAGGEAQKEDATVSSVAQNGLFGGLIGWFFGGTVPLASNFTKSVVTKPIKIAQEGLEFFRNRKVKTEEVVKLLKDNIPDSRTARYVLDGADKIEKDPVAINAIRQGIPDADVAIIKGASLADKGKMAQMLDIRQSQTTNKNVIERATDVVGDTFMSLVQKIQSVNKNAASKLDDVAKGLRGKKVDVSNEVQNFISKLQDYGVAFVGDVLDFLNSDFENVKSAEKAINDIWKRVVRLGKNPDAYELHRLKVYIDNIVEYGKSSDGLAGKAENALKQFRRSIDSVLDSNFDEYNYINTVYSDTIDKINMIQNAMGRKFQIGDDFSSKSAGVKFRSILSNNQNRGGLLKLLDEIQKTSEKYGLRSGEDIISQVNFADLLEDIFGSEAPTSFMGQIEKVGNQVGDIASDVATGKPFSALFKSGKAVYDKTRGISQDEKVRLIRELLSR